MAQAPSAPLAASAGGVGSPWGVAGHDWAVMLLDRALRAGALAHALLFSGPPSIGKTALARALAQALNCSEPPRCGHCRSCRLIARDAHPDVRLLARPADKRNLGIDEIKELREDVVLRPIEARRKVYILREAGDLSEPAANALLKTLEEPPPGVVLVLTAADAGLLLPTIVSRCQHFRLRPVPWAAAAAYLAAEGGLERAEAERLATLSEGRLGWALRAARDATLLDARAARLALLEAVLQGGTLARLRQAAALAETWSARPEEVRETLAIWRGWWREQLLLALAGDAAARFDAAVGWRLLARTQRALDDLGANVNARLALDGLMLAMPRPAGG